MYFKMVAVCLAIALAPVMYAGIITNGDFQTGDLTGWTTYHTLTGSNGTGYPIATQFDVTGGGSSYAATFNVGMVSGTTGKADYEGGGIYQSVSLAAGSVTISFDWAENNIYTGLNVSAGRLELLLDGAVIGTQADQQIQGGQILRGNLSGTSSVLAGSHEIRIQVTRNYGNPGTTPFEYIDNVTATGGTSTGTPEPGSSLLILAGMGVLLARRRLKNPV